VPRYTPVCDNRTSVRELRQKVVIVHVITGRNEYFTSVEENAIYTPKLLKGHKPNSSLSMEPNFRKQENLCRTEQQVF